MIAILTSLIIILDQVSKYIVSTYLEDKSLDVIKGVFSINLVHNRGAAFGILQNQTVFFIFISILSIAILAILWGQASVVWQGVRKRPVPTRHKLLKISLPLILGGAIGNLIDRIRFGYVIDFFDFKIWPVFNIADSAITIGAILLVIYLFKVKSKKSKVKNIN